MKTGKPTKRRLIILIAVIVAIAVALSSALIRGTAAGKNVTQSLLAPFESALSALTRTAERYPTARATAQRSTARPTVGWPPTES